MQVNIVFKDNWDEPQTGVEGIITRRLRAVQKYSPHLEISNQSGSVQTIAMVLRPTPIGTIPRSLWINVSNSFHSIFLLQPSVPREVLVLAIEVEPGTTDVNLYSPEGDALLPDGSFVSFEYEMPIVIGTIKRERSFNVAQGGNYRLGVHLTYQASTGLGPYDSLGSTVHGANDLLNGLTIDGADFLPVLATDNQNQIATTTVNLSAGTHTIIIDQKMGASIPVTLVPIRPEVNEDQVLDIRYESISPSHLRASVRSEHPVMIVLNELFDRRWEATINGVPVETHLRVNGFANGFFVDQVGEYEIELRSCKP